MSIQSKENGLGGIYNIILILSSSVTNEEAADFAYSEGINLGLVNENSRFLERYNYNAQSYALSLSLIIAKYRPEIRQFLEDNIDEEWLAVFSDAEGNYIKAGSLSYPLILQEDEFSPGQRLENRNQKELKFIGIADRQAEFIGDINSDYFLNLRKFTQSLSLLANTPQSVTHNLGNELYLIEIFEQATGQRIGSVDVQTLNSNQIQITSLINININIIIIA